MGTVSLKDKPGQYSALTEVPGCLELLIDQTGTIYTPNLDEISEICKDDFKQLCKMLAQVALMEMQAPRILH
jgi:hydroxymethylpyrimidine/phosphomethylpyrimidine kinase